MSFIKVLLLIFGGFLTLVVSSTPVQNFNQSTLDISKHRTKHKINYRYLCLADETDGIKSEKHLGIACNCPLIFAPVCASDNHTYHNRCVLHCKAKHATDLYQKYRLVLKKFGEC
ncbi:uncharacterized protein LOC110852570 [Folsomia candida]|uniref:Leech-derived tryptase inhibitor C n=1 Tax=Folsomia candida TaxID=158441 RepID=A0A226E3L3_FOLCA|nr:uncharacterized protein LOC110852570 [Folsomia candida]OXA51870.1 Leech-derived tryptase inhibitor C [Folsomia candida]